jgi:hypothetical protein
MVRLDRRAVNRKHLAVSAIRQAFSASCGLLSFAPICASQAQTTNASLADQRRPRFADPGWEGVAKIGVLTGGSKQNAMTRSTEASPEITLNRKQASVSLEFQ